MLTILLPEGPPGLQLPRVRNTPLYRSTAGTEAAELAESAGLHLDPWQRLALDDMLGERTDSKWASFEVGILVARQNGKGAIIEARELAGMFLFDDKLIIHSAHEFRTAQEAFLRIKSLIDNTDALRRRVKTVRTSHGEEGIELLDGTRLRFMARSRSSGRGFSGDTMVLDEAQELPLAAMAAMMPTLSARPNPQIIYAGTVPAPENDSEHFTSVRDRGRSGLSKSLAWLEWSPGEEWSDLNDRRAWAMANPARGYRITDEFIERELEALSAPDFLRERLSVWPKNSAGSVISATEWRGRLDAESQAMNPVVLALDIPPNRECASIASAGRREADGVHLEVIDRQAGTGWVVARLKELNQTWKPRAVIVDSAGPAASLIAELTAAGVPVVTTSAREMAQACGALYDAIQNDQVWHIGQPELDDAVAAATKRPLQDAWAWQRKGTTDISPLVAVTLAYHGHLTTPSYSALGSVW